MKTASRKAKGRKLQQLVRDTILAAYPQLVPDDVRSTGMGQGGEDIMLSPAARQVFPFKIECKNDKRFKLVFDAYDQCKAHKASGEPIVVFKINREKPMIALDLNYFMELLKRGS